MTYQTAVVSTLETESLPPEMVAPAVFPFMSYLVFVSVSGGFGSAAKARPQGNRASQAAEALISHGRVLYCLAQKMPVFQISGRFLVFKLKEIFSHIASFESRFFLILHNINPK